MIKVETITLDTVSALCRKITVDLTEYFGLPKVNEHYAIGISFHLNLVARIVEEYVGLISIDFPYPKNTKCILDVYFKTSPIEQGEEKSYLTKLLSRPKIEELKTISVET